jgi:hypothetical protein
MATKRQWITIGGVGGVVLMVGALVVAFPLLSSWSEWRRIDNAADDFQVPPGFTEVARPRQGTAFCFVTCTNGGEAIVTIVLASDYEDPEEACRALRPAVVELTGDADEADLSELCGWSGELGGAASVFAGAGPAASFGPTTGHRWSEVVDVPDTAVVAYVEFNSGIE